MQYLNEIDRDLVHTLWEIKEDARKAGRKLTLRALVNTVLRDALEDTTHLRARYCTPVKEP